MHAIAFPVMLLFSFCCFDFSFHGIQQEIETVDPLLILVNGPEQRISLPEQEPPLCLGFFLAFIRQKLFRHCRIAACVFQIAQEQDGLSVRFSHPVHLLWLVWVSVNQYNVKDNYSKYFLSMGVDA